MDHERRRVFIVVSASSHDASRTFSNFDALAELHQRSDGLVTLAYDWAGSKADFDKDFPVRQDLFEEWKQARDKEDATAKIENVLKDSSYWKEYTRQVEGAVRQAYCSGLDVTMCCVGTGPVTSVERSRMPEIRKVIIRNLESEQLAASNASDHIEIREFSYFHKFDAFVHREQGAPIADKRHWRAWFQTLSLIMVMVAYACDAFPASSYSSVVRCIATKPRGSNIFACLKGASRPTMAGPKENYIFLGNPGCGKSTLLNALMGGAKFEAGLSLFTGKTTVASSHEVGGVTYVDTPGLEDVETREQAAEEIIKALRGNAGRCKIGFVMDLNGGRFAPAHISTLRSILEATHFRNFGILINKMPQPIYEKWMDNSTGMESELSRQLSSLLLLDPKDYKLHVHAIPTMSSLTDKENAVMTGAPLKGLNEFMQNLPFEEVDSSTITQIKIEEYKLKLDNATRMIKQLMDKIHDLEEKMEGKRASWWR